jgi:hypothetical protein
MTEELEGDPFAGSGQANAAIELVVDEPIGRELLHHRCGRRRRDPHPLGECRGLHMPALRLQLVDLAEVVLDRVAEIRDLGFRRHRYATSSPVTYMTTIPAR